MGGKQFAVDKEKEGSALRWQVGADDKHQSVGHEDRGKAEATVDRGMCLPIDEIDGGHSTDLSQVQRDDSRARAPFVSGAERAASPSRPDFQRSGQGLSSL